MSAAPTSGLENLQVTTISSDTPEGQQLIQLLELDAALKASGSKTDTSGLVPLSLPTDPDLIQQWNLLNVGQVANYGGLPQKIFGTPGEDINVLPVWDRGITGEGILVAVVDTGVQSNHPDLQGNINLVYALNAITGGTSIAPTGNNATSAHGTEVAGLIGAIAGNGLGGVGVAYGSTIVPIKLLASTALETQPTDLSIRNAIIANGAPIDIFNHSWGPFDPENPRAASGPSPSVLSALIQSATTGRGGLGAIHVFSSGNNAGPEFSPGFQDIGFYDSAQNNGYANLRYVISVGMVDEDGSIFNDDGSLTLYGEAGSNILVVAPSASGPFDIATNFATGSGIFTTDLTSGGNNIPTLPNGVSQDLDKFPNTDYTTRFGGTSAAAPEVSGVIALMLEADKEANNGVATLTYRDVQEILVRSARQNDPNDGSWVVNPTPFFQDPIRHDGDPPNYDEGGMYPDDEDAWNDEIIYRIVPGMITTPAMQAATALLTAANGAKFSIHAVAMGPHDGLAGNDVGVMFVSVAGPTGVIANLQGTTIKITVSGSPAWSAIKSAVDGISGGGDFTMVITAGGEASLFNPADSGLTGMLTGGVDAVGENPTVERRQDYVGYNPALDPLSIHNPAPLFTNGAGYTVSQGWITDFGAEYGFGHGVVDADLAVKLASQWHQKDQNLAPEKTQLMILPDGFKVKGAEVIPATDAIGDEVFVPGGLLLPSERIESFTPYFQEFFKEPTVKPGDPGDPMAMPPVPATEDSIDPKSLPFREDNPPTNHRGSYLPIDGPSGMSLEWVELQIDLQADANALDFLRITLVSPDGTESELNHYQYSDPVAGNNEQFLRGTATLNGFVAVIDPPGTLDTNADGDGVFSWTYSTNRNWGERSDGIWQLHFENYSSTDINIPGMRLIYHGQPITGDRYLGFVNDSSGYLGHGTDVTVYVKDTAGNRVAQFITGADGNYYFDLPGGDYKIGIDVPAGYKLNSPNDVPLSDGVNFDISPLVPVSDTVTLSGQVFADLDGDGVQDAVDGGVKNFIVYADLNHTGQFEAGEPNTLSDKDGNYALPFTIEHSTIITVGVKPAPGWTSTNPASGFRDQLAELGGGDVSHVNFGVQPPAAPTGQGNASIYGFVYNDVSGDGQQQEDFEFGIPGLTVFLDANHDGIFQVDGPNKEVSAMTSETGAYQFFDVAPSTVRIAVVVDQDAFDFTSPSVGYLDVTVVAGQIASGSIFGIHDRRINDFGDLVGVGFRSTLAQDGPRNYVIPGFSLGMHVDAEVDARIYDPDTDLVDPSRNGVGDDQDQGKDDTNVNHLTIDDEDGVVLVGGLLRRGSNLLDVTVQGVGGYLQGWIDFDNSGTFENSERVFTNLHINPGPHPLTVNAPDTLLDGQVAARFRWGTFNIDYFGADIIGEVEDYLLTAKAVIGPGDFNGDDTVDGADYDLWKATFGSTTDLRADGNHNGRVDASDYTVWQNNLGMTYGGGGGGSVASTLAESSALDVDLTRPMGGSGSDPQSSDTPLISSFGLDMLQFSATITPAGSSSFVDRSAATAADRVDSALLLLAASDAAHRESARVEDAFDGDADWMGDAGRDATAFDEALALAFDGPSGWWKSL